MKLSQNLSKAIMMFALLMVVVCAGCSSKSKLTPDPAPSIDTNSTQIAPGTM